MKRTFIVSDRIRELAKREGWPDPDSEVNKFLDHHEATGWKRRGGITIVNKEAAFRTWLTKAKEYAKQAPRPNGYVPAPKEPAKPKAAEPTQAELNENRRKFEPLLQGLIKKFDVRKKA